CYLYASRPEQLDAEPKAPAHDSWPWHRYRYGSPFRSICRTVDFPERARGVELCSSALNTGLALGGRIVPRCNFQECTRRDSIVGAPTNERSRSQDNWPTKASSTQPVFVS